MKRTALLIAFFTCVSLLTQAQKLRDLDKSPMDMAYYPDDFAHDRRFAPAKVGDKAFARVTYSRPARKDREVFGKLVPYGKVWRVGANEATEIKLFTDATVQGKPLKAGVYSFYAIPTETEWTLIFSTDLDQWGAYSYKPEMDVLRVTAPVKKTTDPVENLTVQFRKAGEATSESVMMIAWGDTQVDVPISFK